MTRRTRGSGVSGTREFPDGEGAWNFVARGTPEAGAAFRVGFDPIVDEMFKAARAEGREEPREAYAFDALIEMARPLTRPPAARTKKPVALGSWRYCESIMRSPSVERSRATRSARSPGSARSRFGRSVIPLGNPTTHFPTMSGDVANVTHLGRSPTVAQQVALWWLSPMCTNEDCTRTWRLENDHRIGWAETQRTRVDELDPLCDHEHDLKTYYGWALVPGTGRRPFVPPTDPRHPKNQPPPDP